MAPKAAPKAAPAAAKAEPKAKAKAKAKVEKEEEGPKMDAPDREEFDAAVAKIAEAIEGFQKEQQALAAKISERSGGKDEYYAKRAEIRAQLDEFTSKIDGLMERKAEVNKAVGDKRAEGADMKSQLNKMKKAIGYTSEADIDERIASIDFRLNTDTMTLKEEKDLLKEISELKRNRPKVSQVNKMQDSLSSRDTGAGLKENIGEINEQVNLYRDGKRKVQEQLSALNEGRKSQVGDMPDLIQNREGISKKIQEKIAERNTLRDEFRQKEREFNNFKNEQRRLKQEKYMEERAKQQAEWDMSRRQKKADEVDQQPYVSEITLLEQTILFCKSLVKDKGPATEQEKKEIAHNNPDGTEIMLRKEDREEEFYFVPTSSKKKGKSNKQGGGKAGGAKPIKHNAETFKLFDQLKLNAPITTDDVPAILEKLEEQLVSFQEKVKIWEIKRDEMKQKILAGEDAKEEEKEKKEEEAAGEEAKED